MWTTRRYYTAYMTGNSGLFWQDLRIALSTFSFDALRTLCAELNIDVEEISYWSSTNEGWGQAIIHHCAQRQEMPKLLAQLRVMRPNMNWPSEAPKAPRPIREDLLTDRLKSPSAMRFRDAEQRKTIREMIVNSFSLDEMEVMADDLDISNGVTGNTKISKARDILEYMNRHNRVEDLIDYCVKERPKENWQKVWGQETSKPSDKSTDLKRAFDVMTSFNEKDLKRLCSFLDVEWESLPSTTLVGKIRDLITYIENREVFHEDAILKIRELRPD